MKKHLLKLTVLLLTLIVGIGQMEARTFSGGEILYFTNVTYSEGGTYGYAEAKLVLRTTSESNKGATFVPLTAVAGNSGYYQATIPAGNWNYMLIFRTNASKWEDCAWHHSGGSACWNNTWQLTIDGTANLHDGAKENTGNGTWRWMIPKGATFYFDKTNIGSDWGSSVYLRIGRSNNAERYGMSGPVTGTKSLYKYTMTSNYINYSAFIVSNNYGYTGDGQNIVNIGGGPGNPAYISNQITYVESTTLNGLYYTFIPTGSSSPGDGNKCTYWTSTNYNYKKTWTITCSSVANATVELYYWDESNVMQTVSEGNSAQVLPTTKVWCKVTPDAGYSLRKVNLYDPNEREWTDASREDGDFEQNCYVVRTNVTFTAVIEPYATKTILVKDVNSWAPNMYFKGWNPFSYELYDNKRYHYAIQKVSDKINLCGDDYYVVTLSNEFPFYYIHNENDASRTAFFATNRLTHMAKYNDNTVGDRDWGLVTAPCSDMIYWVETYKGSGPKYISNIVANTTDTLSFYVESGGTVDFHAGSAAAANQYSSLFATYFASGQALYGKAGGIFTATPNAGGTGLANVAIFDGDYHIHVNATTRNYLTNGASKEGTTGTKFTSFDKSALFGDTYDHYWVDWFLGSGDAGGYGAQSVVATVGNVYNSNLSEVLGADAFAPKGMTLSTGGNVRYGYDPETNAFTRSMLSGNGDLIKISAPVEGTVIITDGGGETDAYTTPCSFDDATNWVYTLDADVKGQAHATVTSEYNDITYTLSDDAQLLGGSPATTYEVEISYDFKTNRVLGAWMPVSGTAITGFSLESNLMVVRVEDSIPTVLNITGAGNNVTNIGKIYTTFELWQDSWIDTKKKPYAKRRVESGLYTDEYYWFSLPYKCYMGDVFGIEGYGPNGSWVIMTYHGDYRARDGWWAETESWWYYMDRTDTLQANQGYVLRVTNLNGENSLATGIIKRFVGDSGSKLYLYFPSFDNDLTVGPLTGTVTTHLDSLKCTKWRKWKDDPDKKEGENNPNWDRRAIDSNWRIIGSPSFNSTKITDPVFITASADTDKDGVVSPEEYQAFVESYIAANPGATPYSLKYFYNWEIEDGAPKYTIVSAATTEFVALSAHLVQYAGDITWAPWETDPEDEDYSPLVGIKAPKRQQEEGIGEQTLRLVLQQGDREADIAYISRMAFGATMGYDLNKDLSKMINARSANIYTISELYKMAGNCIPDTVTTLPVGVQLASAGEYTFAMPEGTYGTGVVLIDKATDTRTNLALTDYTVTLPAGTCEDRFVLELSPIAQVPTGVETISDEGLAINGARKVMVDGTLYIVKDGKVYDAQGRQVK